MLSHPKAQQSSGCACWQHPDPSAHTRLFGADPHMLRFLHMWSRRELPRGAHASRHEASEPEQVHTPLIYVMQGYQPTFILQWAEGQVHLPTSTRRLCNLAALSSREFSLHMVSLWNGEGEKQCLCRAAPTSWNGINESMTAGLKWEQTRGEASLHFCLLVSESHTTGEGLPATVTLPQEKASPTKAQALDSGYTDSLSLSLGQCPAFT